MDLGFAILFIIAAAYALYRIGARSRRVDHGLPAELRDAPIAFAEQTFRSSRFGLVARVDRAYRVGTTLTLVELKTRDCDVVYLSDRIELSVQRLAVSDVQGESVSDVAWVVVQDRVGRRWPHRVRLLSIEQVLQLKSRYETIMQGGIESLPPAGSRSQCQTCGHLRRCSQKYRDR